MDNKTLIDDNVLFAAIALIVIGIIMVYSASIAYAGHDKLIHNPAYYMIRHIEYVILGITCGFAVFSIPSSFYQKYVYHISIVIVILLLAVLIPHIGKVVNGSRRWIGVGMLNLQPSELAKLGISIFLAAYVCNKPNGLKSFRHDILPILGSVVLVSVLLLGEPDMGSTTVVFIIALGILYLADINKNIIIGFTSIGVVAFVLLVVLAPYRMRRVLGFINPWSDALGKGYQLTHSLLAIGHGGWLGVGLGNSIEKWFYLPEAHTDFILAVIAEETGIIGVLLVLSLFWVIFYRGINIIGRTAHELGNRSFQAMLSYGISLWFLAQALVNVGVATGILPTKGLTLPFISYGGSSIVVSCVAIAMLLRIDYENKIILSNNTTYVK